MFNNTEAARHRKFAKRRRLILSWLAAFIVASFFGFFLAAAGVLG